MIKISEILKAPLNLHDVMKTLRTITIALIFLTIRIVCGLHKS